MPQTLLSDLFLVPCTTVAPGKRPAGGPDGSFAADRGPEWPAATTGKNRSRAQRVSRRERSEHPVASSASNLSVA